VHDVFVLQIAGEKHWRIHEPVHVDPLRDQPWSDHRAEVAARAQERPTIDETFRPGDALYLPRGWIHSAEALGGVSVHLTIGVAAYTRHDVVQEAVARAADTAELRASLPLGFDPADPSTVAPVVEQTVEALIAALADPSAREAVAAAVSERMPPPLRPSGSVVEIHVNGWDRATQWWLRFLVLAIELGLGAVLEFGPHNGFRIRKVRIMLELSATGLRWKSYYRQIVVSWPEIAELRTPTRLLEFRPASDDFPLRRPELHDLRQADGWYRLPATLSATASKEFKARIREVLPGGVAWTG